MKIFGDDGFRSVFGQKYMTVDFLSAFANSVADYQKSLGPSEPILLCRDTRSSGKSIENLMSSVLIKAGISVRTVGILPTPGLSCILGSGSYSMGIMITASHDPAHYNGIKLFASNGSKLEASVEKILEEKILSQLKPSSSDRGEVWTFSTHRPLQTEKNEVYVKSLRSHVSDIKTSQKILVDCSHGAATDIIKETLRGFSNIHFVFDQPNGQNINSSCGALESESLLKLVQEYNYDYGIAFDGDADRAVFVCRDYGVIETEKLMILFSELLGGTCLSKKVVSTEICNLGLEENCRVRSLELVQTEVGDRNVVQAVNKQQAILGAEPSGHFYFPQFAKTMDGPLACVLFLKLIESHKSGFINRLRELAHYERKKCDIQIDERHKKPVRQLYEALSPIVKADQEKLVVRPSMWDPVLRIYYDYKFENRFSIFEDIIQKELAAVAKKEVLL